MQWPPTPSDFADAVAALVRESFDKNAFLAPVAFVFATRNPDTGRRIEPTLLTFILFGTPSSFASQLKELARDVSAPMIMQAYEVRMVGTLSDQHARGWEHLENNRDANDYVVLFVEERATATTLAWIAPVTTCVLGTFEQVPIERVSGWLTCILTPES